MKSPRMQLILSIHKSISYLRTIVAGSKERVQDGFNQKCSKVKRAEADFFASVTCGVPLATTVTCFITRTINLVAMALLFIGVGSIVVPVFEANAQNPTVRIWTNGTTVSHTDYSEWGLSLNTSQPGPITVGITLGGTAMRSGTDITQVIIPAGQTTVRSRQEFSGAGTYTVAVNSSTSYGFGSSTSISVTVVDGTSLPAVTLGTAPTVASTQVTFSINAEIAPTQTSRLTINYAIIDQGVNKGYFPGGRSERSRTFAEDAQTAVITILITRPGVVDGDGVIRVEIIPGSGYKIGTPAFRDIAIPSHISGKPEVSLEEVPDSVTQGHDFRFKLEADGEIEAGGLDVTVQFGEGLTRIITGISPGTYVDGGDSTINVPRSGSVEVTVSTTKSSSNANQNLTITLAGEGSTYTISSDAGAGLATVTSKVNSSPSTTNPRILVKSFPSGYFSAGGTQNITFMVVSSHIPATTTTFNFRAFDTGTSFLDAYYGSGMQQLNSTGLETELDLDIASGHLPDGTHTGTITLELVDGMGYTLADSPNHTTTANLTSDSLSISIADLSETVTQGYSFNFKIKASAILFSPLSVRILLSDGSSGIIVGATPAGVFNTDGTEGMVTIPTSGLVEVAVMTTNPAGSSGNVNGNIRLFRSTSGVSFQVPGGGASFDSPVMFKDNNASTASQPRVSIAADSTALVRADQGANANFTITATPQPTGTISVSYNVSETGNFVTDGTSTIDLSATTTMLPILTSDSNVGTDDADSTITVTLLEGANYSLADPNGHIATAIATDDNLSELTISPGTLNEGATSSTGTMSFTVRVSPAVTNNFTVNWATSIEADDKATEGNDYTGATGMLNFAAGDSMKTIMINIIGDDTPEPDETFTVTLTFSNSVTGVNLQRPSAKGTITNDDGIGLSIADVSMEEGADGMTTNMVFMVEVVPPSNRAITFDWTTSTETTDEAISGTDYTASSGDDVTIAVNESTSTLMVPIIGDDDLELNETFTVTLSGASAGVVLVDAIATGTIVNDDGEEIKIAAVSRPEGASGDKNQMQFIISVETAVEGGFTVDWTTSIEIDDNATENTDYTKGSGKLTFATADTSKTIDVEIIGDDTPEFDETFTITLSNQSLGTYISTTNGSAKGTITNDDGSGLSIEAASIAEGVAGVSTSMEFKVTVIPPSSSAITYYWATSIESDDNATTNEDFRTSSQMDVLIMANAPSSIFSVPIIGDHDFEENETFTVTLSNPTGASLLVEQVKGTIINDDVNIPRVSIELASGSDSADGVIREGQIIDIAIVSNPAPTEPIDVAINVDQGDKDLYCF